MPSQITVTRCRHNWPEDVGWTMDRPNGLNEYVFLHFLTPVDILINGQIQSVPANSCLFYDIGTPQWFTCRKPMYHNWMHLTGDLPGVLQSLSLKTNTLYHPQNAQFITQLIRDIESEFLTTPPLYDELIRAKLQCLLIQLSRSCLQSDTTDIPSDVYHRLQEMRQQVFTNLNRDWTVAEMSALVGFSPSYFQVLYKKAFKVSPTEDLIRARIDVAKNLLSGTSTPIFEIAYSLGYNCEAHFCRQFKQRTGISASNFRANSTNISSANRQKKKKSK